MRRESDKSLFHKKKKKKKRKEKAQRQKGFFFFVMVKSLTKLFDNLLNVQD